MIFLNKEPIDKGWSPDKKYCVTAENGQKFLLRVSPAERREKAENVFRNMERIAALAIPMCRPVACRQEGEEFHALYTWVDGRDAESVIPDLDIAEQYAYGCRAGKSLKTIHSFPAPAGVEDWGGRFGRKIDRKLQLYRDCPLKYSGGEALLSFIREHRYLIEERPQTYQHGDYHIGNMMIDQQGELVIIDFDKDDYGDPWEEFNRIVWSAQAAPYFASGMVDGYFDGRPPEAFWELLALYISCNTLSSLPWAIPFGEKEVDTMLRQCEDVLGWYDNMKRVIPAWYRSLSKTK